MNFKKNKNILVIGSDGFVGSYFCKYLEKKGENVVRFDIKRGMEEDARKMKFDLENIDFIYFLAWDVGGAKYLYKKDTQLKQMEWNIDLLSNIFKQIINKPFVFISSQLAENVETVYGAQKKLGEVWTSLSEHGCCLRLWNVYGQKEGTTERSHVIGDMVNQALHNKEIKLLTTGEEKRQFIFIEDVCDAFYEVFKYGYVGKYDVTSFEWISIIEVANIIAKKINCKVIAGKEIGSDFYIKNLSKIRDWLPKTNIEDGIKKTIENFKKI
jgi:nucleoside-diphosphate-sugar epimerase